MLVDFTIIGTMKSGTTSLAYQLAQHPKICFSQPKETHYFSTTEYWKKELKRYHAFFDPSSGQICGEASPTYTCLPEYPGTARRLYNYNPDMRLICIMRQPVHRIISHYKHRVIRNKEKSPPGVAVFADSTYINRSRYAVQLQPYFDLFPPNNILLLIFEEYICSMQETLSQIAEFLDVSPTGFNNIDLSVKNPSVSRGRPTLLARLVKPYARSQGLTVCTSVEELKAFAPFDIIISTPVLEHLRFPNNALKEITSVLKPESYGLITCIVPHVEQEVGWDSIKQLLAQGHLLPKEINPWEHLNYFTTETLSLFLVSSQ